MGSVIDMTTKEIMEIMEIQEKMMRKHLPIFRAYLRGEDVEHLLPFDEKVAYRFRHLMAEEVD